MDMKQIVTRGRCLIAAVFVFGAVAEYWPPRRMLAAPPAQASRTSSQLPGESAVETLQTTIVAKVSVSRPQQKTIVQVSTSGTASYQTIHLSDPERLVLDFQRARLAIPATTPSSYDPVFRIRAGQFKPDVVRVVIDLREISPYRINREENTVTVEFGTAESATATNPSLLPGPTSGPSGPSQVPSTAPMVKDAEPRAVPVTVAALCPSKWTIRLVDMAFQELRDEDILWADLVMVSAMHVQRDDTLATLERCSRLNRRTIIGGPYASAEPEAVLSLADHVVVGEPDEIFSEIAADLETGSARRLYRVADKPDVSCTPIPRFDLLDLDKYILMAVQFSRGCPFTCEFCDIITLYGRRPRTKSNAQMIGELEALLQLGWRKEIFIVDDNFIGNHKAALDLALALEQWQQRHGYPFRFGTEASMDLAAKPELLKAMVRANFWRVFIGIETPSAASLKETKKFQNLRQDPLESIHFIQKNGLWVTGGFIVGFDSDGSDIFDRQIEFIERAAIPWAMTGALQAPHTTPLYERMKKEKRLIETKLESSNFAAPNFQTVLPIPDVIRGLKKMLLTLYEPDRFYERVLHSLECWQVRPEQKGPVLSWSYRLEVISKSVLRQGLLSEYRGAYWRFLRRMIFRWGRDDKKRQMGFELALSGHHFINYARQAAETLDHEILGNTQLDVPGSIFQPKGPAANLVRINGFQ